MSSTVVWLGSTFAVMIDLEVLHTVGKIPQVKGVAQRNLDINTIDIAVHLVVALLDTIHVALVVLVSTTVTTLHVLVENKVLTEPKIGSRKKPTTGVHVGVTFAL